MKKLLALLLIICGGFLIPATAQDTDKPNPNGFNIFYYPNGKKSSEGNLVNGKPDGIWKSYYENGNLKSEGNRVGGKLEGLWKFYNEDGTLSAEYNYAGGNKNGSQKEFYVNGKVRSDEPVVNGVKEGLAKYYSESGALVKEVPFEKGVENGKGRSYNEQGLIINLSLYKNGYLTKDEKINRTDKFGFKQGTWKEFYPNYIVRTEANYKDDKLEGPFKYYNTDGTFTKMDIYKNGEQVIDQTANVKLEIDRDYHKGGRVKSSVNIIDGKKQGVYREYDINGKITSSKLYRDNEVYAEGLVDENMKCLGNGL